MNVSYKTVVNYVKNLFPGKAPVEKTDNPILDADVLSMILHDKFYIVASNGHRYWYAYAQDSDMPVARYILRSNGIDVRRHNSRYIFSPGPVLRVRTACLSTVPGAREFIEMVMNSNSRNINEAAIKSRIAQIRQKVK